MTTPPIIHRLLNGELSPQDVEQLRKDPELKAYLRIIEEAGSWEAPEGMSREEAWQMLLPHFSRQAVVRRFSPWPWALAAAAAVALLLFFIWPSGEALPAWRSHPGESIAIQLEDGSTVTLNASSQLTALEQGDERRYRLSGEALFEVAKGTPFIVETHAGEVRVLGTRFVLLSSESSYRISCLEGVVAVHADGFPSDTLLAGEGLRLTTEGWQSLAGVSQDAAWNDGMTHFREVPIREVLDAFERQFGLQVEYQGPSKLYTGGFPHEESGQALDLILRPLGLEIEARDAQRIRLREIGE